MAAREQGRDTDPSGTRLLHWGVAGAAALAVAGGVAFAYASMHAMPRLGNAGDAVTVTLRDGACEPNALSVPAGRATFRIVNATDRAVEWEILDGVMVVEERENIAPGMSQSLSARLDPGTYAVICGLLGNPRGTLTVTPAAGGDPGRPRLVAFIGPLAEYQVFLTLQANALVKAVGALDAAVRAGDLKQARSLYGPARAAYLKMRPVAGRFSDLDGGIAPLAAYLDGREADPAFTGFHRIEYGLFRQNGTDGLAAVSARLVADATALKERLRDFRLAPADMVDGAARVSGTLADALASGGEERYAGIDLADAEAELAGIRKIVTLLEPVTLAGAADAESSLADAGASLAALRGPDGYPPLDALDKSVRDGLVGRIRALGGALGRMSDAIGPEGLAGT